MPCAPTEPGPEKQGPCEAVAEGGGWFLGSPLQRGESHPCWEARERHRLSRASDTRPTCASGKATLPPLAEEKSNTVENVNPETGGPCPCRQLLSPESDTLPSPRQDRAKVASPQAGRLWVDQQFLLSHTSQPFFQLLMKSLGHTASVRVELRRKGSSKCQSCRAWGIT